MSIECYCEVCEKDCDVDKRNYLHYLLPGSQYDSIGCGGLCLHAFLLLVTGGVWGFFMIVFAFSYGTRYFCKECGELTYEDDLWF